MRNRDSIITEGHRMNPFSGQPRRGEGRRGRHETAVMLTALMVALACLGIGAGAASAQIQLTSFTAGALGSNATQAGAHVDVQTTFMTASDPNLLVFGALPIQAEGAKDVTVDLPVGFAGSTTAVPKCTLAHLTNSTCPVDSQVGTAEIIANGNFLVDGQTNSATYGVYMLQPSAGHTAEFGFTIAGLGNVLAVATVRSGTDYGLHVELKSIPSELTLFMFGARLTLWGVPADPSHDASRAAPGSSFVDPSTPVASAAPLVPFLTNPTSCDGSPVVTSISLDSYQSPGQFTSATADAPPVTGCDRLSFNPSLDLRPDSGRAGQPAGYQVDLKVPQNESPNALGTANVKDVTVTLPQGVSVSPSSADGLKGCPDREAGIGTPDPVACPAGSKIGTVSIVTPLLSDPLEGSIYLGQPLSNDAQTGQMLRLFLIAEGSGVRVKLVGSIKPDASTGQLVATFANNPQLSFNDLLLHFQAGSRAPLTNPQTCGTYTTNAAMTSWGGQSVSSSSSFQITQDANGGPCHALGFSPTFNAGTTQSIAGKSSPFSLTFGRSDNDQDLGSIAVSLPPGLLGRIASVPLCPDGAANTGTCAPVSRIGSATTAAGAGPSPLYLGGSVFLTGPYKGAPFGLSITVPAVAGPFDLGTVVVRAAIFVDRTTAALRIVSDPLPTILQGIPLRIKTVNVLIDRTGFMFNPSSCAAMSVDGHVVSSSGTSVGVSSRFQVSDCAALTYKPKLSITVGRRGRTGSGATVPATVVLTQGANQANNKVVDVTFPGSINAHLLALQHPCAEADFQKGACKSNAKAGTASAVTPLLRDPLNGSVYFIANPKKGALPLLKVRLHGQVDVDLTGVVSTPGGKFIRTRFETIPDVPISRFRLSLVDTTQGPLGATENLCSAAAKAQTASLGFRAQNGKLVQVQQALTISGCPTKK